MWGCRFEHGAAVAGRGAVVGRCVPVARGRAVAQRVEPLSKSRVGRDDDSGPSRARGSRALFPSRVRERGPLDELTGLQVATLCSARCGAGQIVTPVTRRTRCPGPLKRFGVLMAFWSMRLHLGCPIGHKTRSVVLPKIPARSG